MGSDYYIMYNPLTYNLMDLWGLEGLSPIHLLSYLTRLEGCQLTPQNYLDYLDFDIKKHRQGMVETFAIENYAALYVGNQISRFEPTARLIHSDDKRRPIRQIIAKEGRRPRGVFITTMSSNFPTAVAAAIVLNCAEIPVLLGGIHVSTSPADVTTFIRNYCHHPELVCEVRGAADSQVIPEVLSDLRNGVLRSEYSGRLTIEDGVWGSRKNVEYLPPMQLDLLRRIPLVGQLMCTQMRINPIAPFLGCPYSCNFCSTSSLPRDQRRLIARSTEDLLSELADQQKDGANFSNRFFLFLPDNLLLGGKRLDDLLEAIIERGTKVNFAAQISIDVASNEPLLAKLRLAGATHFFIGFESLELRNLEYIGKHVVRAIRQSGLSVAEYYARQIRKIQDHGISIHGAFIVGLPYDYFRSLEDNSAREIADFCIRNRIGLQPCSLTDLPGAQTFRESQENHTWLYGKQGTMDYLVALCLTDLTETNRVPPASLFESPVVVAAMALQSIRRAGATYRAVRNGLYMARKSFSFPTNRGRRSLTERLVDSAYAFVSQMIVSLYKDHGERVAHSANGVRGCIERLYDIEENPLTRSQLLTYVREFTAAAAVATCPTRARDRSAMPCDQPSRGEE
jgi:radical SAM superfamily enzyme YgiQ (UPF0313 family)